MASFGRAATTRSARTLIALGRDHHLERHADDQVPDLETARRPTGILARVDEVDDRPTDGSPGCRCGRECDLTLNARIGLPVLASRTLPRITPAGTISTVITSSVSSGRCRSSISE